MPRVTAIDLDRRWRAWSTAQRRRRKSSAPPSAGNPGLVKSGSVGTSVMATFPQRDERSDQPVDFGLMSDVVRGSRRGFSSDPDREQPSRPIELEDIFVRVIVSDIDDRIAREV